MHKRLLESNSLHISSFAKKVSFCERPLPNLEVPLPRLTKRKQTSQSHSHLLCLCTHTGRESLSSPASHQ